jgi:hypothetical protein
MVTLRTRASSGRAPQAGVGERDALGDQRRLAADAHRERHARGELAAGDLADLLVRRLW